ncbi:putative permease [Corynebacterium mustelae]|uniref:Putative permease n=1 Tax=Corynebacterium mustelae TaxID=571915 RepID=A0A0G3H4D3_9CORY|nr:AEC family transporter [Corynebacterium mustelae]AKK06668.1 putative permease [Corynebacterium mustelae]
MVGVLEGFVIIFTIIFIGFLLAKFRVISSDEQRLVLNRVAFFAATPALLFTVVSNSTPEELFSLVILGSSLAALATATVFVLLSRLFFRMDRGSTVMGAASTGYVNSNNIGLSVGMYVLDNPAYVAPLLVVQIVLFTPLVLALISEPSGAKSRPRQIASAISAGVFSPIVVGAALGLAVTVTNFSTPLLVAEPMRILGGASIPMILLSFGASLYKATPLADITQRSATVTATLLKVVVMPLFSAGIGWLLGLQGDLLYAVVILAALPTAQNVYNYAATYQRGMTITRDTILLSTFLALPAMLVIAAVFGR